MRGVDPQDLDDVEFMIRHDRVSSSEMESALDQAVIPDLIEFRDAFERAKPLVLEKVRRFGAAF